MSIYPTVLYIKQHSLTGLKYFGKTTRDPLKYLGSGKRWMHHIKKHGPEHVRTLWVSESFIDSELISDFAEEFSKDNNIVESKNWANLINENGLDGGGNKGITPSVETRQKLSDAKKGKPGKTHSAESRQKLSDANKGKPLSAETRQKLSDAKKGKPSKKKGIPNGRKGIPTGPSPRKGIPTGKQQNPRAKRISGVEGFTKDGRLL